MDVSVIIPLLDEQDALPELYAWIKHVVLASALSYEVIFVDDGSTDNSWEIITQLGLRDKHVKGIRFRKNFGKSQGLHVGFKRAQGNVVMTMDADLQDSPDEIPELYRMVAHEGFDLVSGWKQQRYDAIIAKKLPSKLFNWVARKTSGIQLHDFNCGLKAYKNHVVKHIEVTGEMHRYIPILVDNAGFSKITEKVVKHQVRKYGKTKFGADRFVHGFLDLVTIWFLSRFGKRPMHLFGALGTAMFALGFAFSAYLGIDKLFFNPYSRLITQLPQFYIALVTMVIGTQFFVAGFLGEMILRTKQNKEAYIIAEELNY